MTTRLLMALFVIMTIAGAAALTLSGCDDDTVAPMNQDLSSPDLRVNHD